MNIWLVPWYTSVLVEANKLWFYAICISLTRTIWQLLFDQNGRNREPRSKSKTEKRKSKSKPAPHSTQGPSSTALIRKIVVGGCDITLPASFLGWTALGDLGIGVGMVVSTVLASLDVWEKAQ